jgi:hypothetical protein
VTRYAWLRSPAARCARLRALAWLRSPAARCARLRALALLRSPAARCARLRALAWLAALGLAACENSARYEQAVAVLVDVSGTYADETPEVARILKRELLPQLVPGDALALIRVDSESYEQDNVEALLTLDRRPSRANAQKLALAEQLDAFAAAPPRSEYTDIRGAMMLAADFLREAEAGSRVMIVFSDLREELPAGAQRELRAGELNGVQVLAVHVKQLKADSADPQAYRERLALWQRDTASAQAAGWRTVFDTAKLAPLLAQIR